MISSNECLSVEKYSNNCNHYILWGNTSDELHSIQWLIPGKVKNSFNVLHNEMSVFMGNDKLLSKCLTKSHI